jgi:hypothetical protein
MTTVDEVLDLTLARLRSSTPIAWYKMFVPDDTNLTPKPYGVIDVKGPYDVSVLDWGLGGVADQAYRGQLRVAVSSQTEDALRIETDRAVTLLRGWSPAVDVSGFETELVGSFDLAHTKWAPSWYVRYLQFNFTAGL